MSQRRTGAIEGFFIESADNLIFDVKGHVHPPDRIIAYVRYVPDENGTRVKCGVKYRKIYSLWERSCFLKSRYPHYIYYDPNFNTSLQAVPRRLIRVIYDPTERLAQMSNARESLDGIELAALDFVETLSGFSDVPLSSFGVTGSILVGLHKDSSDIDVVVYGAKNCISMYNSMEYAFTGSSKIERYNLDKLIRLYKFRSRDTYIPLKMFLKIASRKLLQGLFGGRDFYIRLVKKPGEVDWSYGNLMCMSIGRARIKARIVDASESIFTPCKYLIEDVHFLKGKECPNLTEIFSFRGRFCECAFDGEEVVAEGKAEKVILSDGSTYSRLILGESTKDFIVPKILSKFYTT